METIDLTGKVKILIRFGLITLLVLSAVIGYAVFHHYHATTHYKITDAKINGTMLSVRALANGKIKELPFQDGDEVQAGDVIAKIEVSVTEEEIKQLESAVEAAKQNYADLQQGQMVKVAVTRQVPIAPPANSPGVKSSGSNTLASLEERAKRMEELFEMGAVSAVQRDAARKKYEDALAEGPAEETPAAPAGATTQTVTEYIERWQPTPPAVLATAESAIKQAELALNVARQEAQQTEITAPFSGIIYYAAAVEEDLSAGEVVAKIGSGKELWLEAEVTEDFFNKISLGKKVSYTIDGKNFSGTLTEKIEPTKVEETPQEETPPAEEKLSEEKPPTENPPAENQSVQTPPPAENSSTENQLAPIPESPEKIPEEIPQPENKNSSDSAGPVNDKFILKFSIPPDSKIDFKPTEKITVEVDL